MSQTAGDRDAFDATEMTAAVEGIAIAQADTVDSDKQASDRKESADKARAHNWAPAVQYDYSVYNANAPEAREPTAGDPEWLHNAAKYEWCDEFGEVGPQNLNLEAQLYHHEFQMRSGEGMEALEYEVELSGAERIRPVRNVSFQPDQLVDMS